MGLFPKNEPGQAVFFSPTKIASVRTHQAEIEAPKEQEKIGKEVEREKKAAGKKQKAQELEERKENRLRIRAEKLAQKAQEKEARTLQNQIKLQLDLNQQSPKKRIRKPLMMEQGESSDESRTEVKKPKTRIAQSGRIISLPTRFQD